MHKLNTRQTFCLDVFASQNLDLFDFVPHMKTKGSVSNAYLNF